MEIDKTIFLRDLISIARAIKDNSRDAESALECSAALDDKLIKLLESQFLTIERCVDQFKWIMKKIYSSNIASGE